MQNMIVFKMSVALVASLLSTQSTFAQGTITTFKAEAQIPDSQIVTTGSFRGEQTHSLSNSTISAQIDLNDADMSVTFRRWEFDIEDIELSWKFPRGVLELIPIKGTIKFHPIVLTDDQALTTTIQQDGNFLINGVTKDLGSTNQPDFSGSYEFSGPTESVEGTFSFDPWWTRLDGSEFQIIGTTNFPNSVTLFNPPSWMSAGKGNLVSETIDGVSISVDIFPPEFMLFDNLEFKKVDIIPKSLIYAFVIGAIGLLLLIAFIAFRRMKFLRSAMI